MWIIQLDLVVQAAHQTLCGRSRGIMEPYDLTAGVCIIQRWWFQVCIDNNILSCSPTFLFMKNKYKMKGFQSSWRLKNLAQLLNLVLFPQVSCFFVHAVLWFVGEPRAVCYNYEDNCLWMDCVWCYYCVIFSLVVREVYVLITVLT